MRFHHELRYCCQVSATLLRPETNCHFTEPFLWRCICGGREERQVRSPIRFVPQLGRISTRKNACRRAGLHSQSQPGGSSLELGTEGQERCQASLARSFIGVNSCCDGEEPSVQGSSGQAHAFIRWPAREPLQFNSPPPHLTRQAAIDSRTVLVGNGSTEPTAGARRDARSVAVRIAPQNDRIGRFVVV